MQNDTQNDTQNDKNVGYLDIIIGPMFSGKSTEMIRRVKRIMSKNKSIVVIKHSSDTRYSQNSICSHDKLKIDCISLQNINDLFNYPEYVTKFKNSKYVAIEEGQFFKDLYNSVVSFINIYHKHVIVVRLDGDYQQLPFGNNDLIRLIPHAENVIKLQGYCQLCDDLVPASFTRRIINSTKQCLVGGKESYIPVCRKHLDKTIKYENLFD